MLSAKKSARKSLKDDDCLPVSESTLAQSVATLSITNNDTIATATTDAFARSSSPTQMTRSMLQQLGYLIEEAMLLSKHSIVAAREAFRNIYEKNEEALANAKYSSIYWIARARLEEDHENFDLVVEIFAQAYDHISDAAGIRILHACIDDYTARVSMRNLQATVRDPKSDTVSPMTTKTTTYPNEKSMDTATNDIDDEEMDDVLSSSTPMEMKSNVAQKQLLFSSPTISDGEKNPVAVTSIDTHTAAKMMEEQEQASFSSPVDMTSLSSPDKSTPRRVIQQLLLSSTHDEDKEDINTMMMMDDPREEEEEEEEASVSSTLQFQNVDLHDENQEALEERRDDQEKEEPTWMMSNNYASPEKEDYSPFNDLSPFSAMKLKQENKSLLKKRWSVSGKPQRIPMIDMDALLLAQEDDDIQVGVPLDTKKGICSQGSENSSDRANGASVVILSNVRTPAKQKQVTQNSSIAIPVRRSIRHHTPNKTTNTNDHRTHHASVLERAEYVYTPNKALEGSDLRPLVAFQQSRQAISSLSSPAIKEAARRSALQRATAARHDVTPVSESKTTTKKSPVVRRLSLEKLHQCLRLASEDQVDQRQPLTEVDITTMDVSDKENTEEAQDFGTYQELKPIMVRFS